VANVWKPLAAIALSSGTVATLSVLFLLSVQSPGCACGDRTGIHLRTLHLAQQAAHFETGRFLSQPDLEAFSEMSVSNISRDTYRYRTELDDSGAIAFGYATPHTRDFQPQLGPFKGRPKPAYHSAVSAITFDTPNDQFTGVICTSSAPSQQPLPAPVYTGNGFECPEATVAKSHP